MRVDLGGSRPIEEKFAPQDQEDDVDPRDDPLEFHDRFGDMLLEGVHDAWIRVIEEGLLRRLAPCHPPSHDLDLLGVGGIEGDRRKPGKIPPWLDPEDHEIDREIQTGRLH